MNKKKFIKDNLDSLLEDPSIRKYISSAKGTQKDSLYQNLKNSSNLTGFLEGSHVVALILM